MCHMEAEKESQATNKNGMRPEGISMPKTFITKAWNLINNGFIGIQTKKQKVNKEVFTGSPNQMHKAQKS